MYVSKVGDQEFTYTEESLKYKNLDLRYRNMENISRVNDIQNPGFVFDYMGNHVKIPCNPDEAEIITDIFIEASKARQKELDMMNAYQDLDEPEIIEFSEENIEEAPMITGNYGEVNNSNFDSSNNNFTGNLTASGSIDLSQLQNDISQMQSDMSYLKQNTNSGKSEYQLQSDTPKSSTGSFMEEFYTLEELENIDADAKKKDEIESKRQDEEGFKQLVKREKKQKPVKKEKSNKNKRKEKKPKKERDGKKEIPKSLKIVLIVVVILIIAVLGLWFYSSWMWSSKGQLTFLFRWLIQHGYNVIM